MMKNWKKLFALLLVAAMIVSLSACGGDNGAGQSTPGSSAVSAPAESSAAAESSLSNEDPVTLKMLLVSAGNGAAKDQQIQEAVNAILSEKLNATVEFVSVPFGDVPDKLNLMLSSGEQMDIFQCMGSYSTFYANDFLLDLTGYEDYYKDITDLAGTYMASGQIGGKQYGLPAIKDFALDYCFIFRQDIIEDCGINVDEIKDYDQLHDMLAAIKEKYPDLVPLMGGGGGNTGAVLDQLMNFEDNCWPDTLGGAPAVLMNPTEDSTVTNYFESESYKMICDYAWQWKQEGLIGFDQMTDGANLLRGQLGAGTGSSYHPRTLTENGKSRTGYDVVALRKLPTANSVLTTSTYWNYCINSVSENPERALQVLNYMYTDKEINNLLAWGIEGEDYQMVSDEGAGVIDYVEGQDDSNVAYYQWAKFSFTNNYLQYVMTGTDPNLWEEMDAFNTGADVSLALGFSFDSSKVSTQIAAVTNVVNQYDNALRCGDLDPAVEIPNFIAALKSAGVDDIITEKQSQLDAFMASK